MKYINEYSNYEKNLFSQVDKKPELFIFNIIKDLEVKYDKKQPLRTFFVHKKTCEVWMVDNKKTGYLWVSYKHIWTKTQLSFPHENLNIKNLIKYVVELTFKMTVGIPIGNSYTASQIWCK